MVAADGGRAPAGGRSPEGGSGGGTPAGPCRSFPSPQGQVPSAPRLGGSPRSLGVVKRLLGPEGAAEPGGGLKTRAARRRSRARGGGGSGGGGGGGCRAVVAAPSRGGELLPPIPCGGVRSDRPCSRRRRRPAGGARARGHPCRAGEGRPAPPSLRPGLGGEARGARSAAGAGPARLDDTGDAGRGRVPSALPL